MSRARYTPRSKMDIRAIATFYADKSPAYAARMIESIRAQCRQLARFPRMGCVREELGRGLRSFSVHPYVVFFRPARTGVLIVRIFRGSMNMTPDKFTEETE